MRIITREEATARCQEIIEALGGDLERIRRKAECWSFDEQEYALWEEYENLKYLLGEEYDDKSEDTESEIYMDDETIEEYATKELLAFGMEKWSKYEDNKYVWPNRYNKLEDTIKMVASIDESTLDTADDIFNVRAAKRLVAFKDAYLPNDDWPLVADYVDTVYD